MRTGPSVLLRRWLKSEKLTQTACARLIDRPQSVISRLVLARRRPDLDTAFAIEDASRGAVPARAWVKSGGSKAA